MIKNMPAPSHRQGNFCALDAACPNFSKWQTQEFCSAYFGNPALDFFFT
jgi:hypothetical protein